MSKRDEYTFEQYLRDCAVAVAIVFVFLFLAVVFMRIF